jgi:hypothetical protein
VSRGRRIGWLVAGAAVLAGAPAMAADGWTFAVSPYAWLPGISTSLETSRGTINADMSTGDTIANLDFAFMGAAEARKDRWGLIVDFMYADLTAKEDTPLGALWSKAEVQTKLAATTVYAGYRVLENEKAAVDVLAGGRFYTLDVTARLDAGRLPAKSRSYSDDWADPVVGLRGRYNFNEKWYATALADAGGFSGNKDSSWQAFGSVGYQFNARWSVQGGWRYMDITKEIDGRDLSIDLSGPLVGLTYRF